MIAGTCCKDLLNEAWNQKFPEKAVAYGKTPLRQSRLPRPQAERLDLDVLWGERGHPIRAWF
jgi:hypothetical protein